MNDFISANASHSDSLLQLVSIMPDILEFNSKRILWRQLVKKNIKKSDDYDIDLQVRREQIFDDSF